MLDNKPDQIAVYELSFEKPDEAKSKAQPDITDESLRAPLLAANAKWFCNLRWIVISILLAYEIFGQSESILSFLGLSAPGVWVLVTVLILTVENTFFLLYTRKVSDPAKTMANLWGQIVVDIMVLTAVIHVVGSLETAIAFTYLFHIVLACVFLTRIQSLIVTILAGTMYCGCVMSEHFLEILTPTTIFIHSSENLTNLSQPDVIAWKLFMANGVWLVVWYLASRLSSMVRERDIELAETNRRLAAAQEERTRHMLTTTHELKSPFAAIHANAQLLVDGYCGELPDEAMNVAKKITARCQRLTTEIQEMLQLANLSSSSQRQNNWTRLDCAVVLHWCISQVESIARKREITITTDIQPFTVAAVEDHLKMLFVNLIANAVRYSHQNGQVRVTSRVEPTGQAVVTISDQGIGIPPDKLPKIFDEHYRTNEAVRHNKESSGLGLAIVKQVAQMHNIKIQVRSQVGRGTTFKLFMSEALKKTATHGLTNKDS